MFFLSLSHPQTAHLYDVVVYFNIITVTVSEFVYNECMAANRKNANNPTMQRAAIRKVVHGGRNYLPTLLRTL